MPPRPPTPTNGHEDARPLIPKAALARGRPVRQRLLPLDAAWQAELAARPRPTRCLPLFDSRDARLALIGEYLQVSLFGTCAESMASENACRPATLQRAEWNIEELLKNLQRQYHSLRQRAMDEELFDALAGFTLLGTR